MGGGWTPGTRLLALVLALLVVQQVGLNLVSLVAQEPVLYVSRYFFGYDLYNGWEAARLWLAGEAPNQVWRYVWLPLALPLLAPLAQLDFATAAAVFFGFNLAALAGGLALCLGVFGRRAWWPWVLGVALLSRPVYHLLERGNLDGLVMLLLAGMVAAAGRPLVSGGLLFVAAGLKAYPALLLGPLLVARDWRRLAGFAAAGLLALVLMPEAWMAAFVRAGQRAAEFQIDLSGGSIFILAHFLADRLQPLVGADLRGPLGAAALAVYLLALAMAVGGDWRAGRLQPMPGGRLDAERAAHLLLYLPWAVAVPVTVFSYTLTALLPMLCAAAWLADRAAARLPARPLLAAGTVLMALQSKALGDLTGIDALRLSTSLGVLCLLVWSARAKWAIRPPSPA